MDTDTYSTYADTIRRVDDFGQRLRALRKSRGLDQSQLSDARKKAARVRFGRYVSKLERNREKNPSLKILEKLAKGLGCSTLSEFFMRLERVYEKTSETLLLSAEAIKLVKAFNLIEGSEDRDVVMQSAVAFEGRRLKQPRQLAGQLAAAETAPQDTPTLTPVGQATASGTAAAPGEPMPRTDSQKTKSPTKAKDAKTTRRA